MLLSNDGPVSARRLEPLNPKSIREAGSSEMVSNVCRPTEISQQQSAEAPFDSQLEPLLTGAGGFQKLRSQSGFEIGALASVAQNPVLNPPMMISARARRRSSMIELAIIQQKHIAPEERLRNLMIEIKRTGRNPEEIFGALFEGKPQLNVEVEQWISGLRKLHLGNHFPLSEEECRSLAKRLFSTGKEGVVHMPLFKDWCFEIKDLSWKAAKARRHSDKQTIAELAVVLGDTAKLRKKSAKPRSQSLVQLPPPQMSAVSIIIPVAASGTEIYSGAQLFWRTHETLDISIYENTEMNFITVQTMDADSGQRYPNIRLDSTKIPLTEEQIEHHLKEKYGDDPDKWQSDVEPEQQKTLKELEAAARQELLRDYILRRLAMPNIIDDPVASAAIAVSIANDQMPTAPSVSSEKAEHKHGSKPKGEKTHHALPHLRESPHNTGHKVVFNTTTVKRPSFGSFSSRPPAAGASRNVNKTPSVETQVVVPVATEITPQQPSRVPYIQKLMGDTWENLVLEADIIPVSPAPKPAPKRASMAEFNQALNEIELARKEIQSLTINARRASTRAETALDSSLLLLDHESIKEALDNLVDAHQRASFRQTARSRWKLGFRRLQVKKTSAQFRERLRRMPAFTLYMDHIDQAKARHAKRGSLFRKSIPTAESPGRGTKNRKGSPDIFAHGMANGHHTKSTFLDHGRTKHHAANSTTSLPQISSVQKAQK